MDCDFKTDQVIFFEDCVMCKDGKIIKNYEIKNLIANLIFFKNLCIANINTKFDKQNDSVISKAYKKEVARIDRVLNSLKYENNILNFGEIYSKIAKKKRIRI